MKIAIILSIIGLFTYLGFSIGHKIAHKQEIAKRLETIPEFHFKTLLNKEFNRTHLKQNTATIFIYFNTECDYCIHEAESILENLELFEDVYLLFVSNESISDIKAFAELHQLLNQKNIAFLYDHTDTFSSGFDANSIPFILIYNKDGILLKKHKGQLKPQTIANVLNENE